MPIIGVVASSTRQGQISDTGAMFAIKSIVIGTATSSVSFTSIPATYSHLQLSGVAATNRATYVDDLGLQFNGDATNGNYRSHRMYGFGSGTPGTDSPTPYTSMNIGQIAGGTTNAPIGNGYGGFVIDIADYGAGKNKTARALSGYDDNGQGATQYGTGLWAVTTAVNQITLFPMIGTTFTAGSRFTLYGIKGA